MEDGPPGVLRKKRVVNYTGHDGVIWWAVGGSRRAVVGYGVARSANSGIISVLWAAHEAADRPPELGSMQIIGSR